VRRRADPGVPEEVIQRRIDQESELQMASIRSTFESERYQNILQEFSTLINKP
jgi:hypothetical protein